jgi:hypothetical protein
MAWAARMVLFGQTRIANGDYHTIESELIYP